MQYQLEKWFDALPELRPLFSDLWEDVAVDKNRFTAKCDEETYKKLESAGFLHLVTARDEGKLAGYFLMFVLPNGHYLGAGNMAFTDMYYVKPEYRRGNIGLQLFTFMEKTLLERGDVVKCYTSHKLHRDRSLMLKFLGWTPTDLVYSKLIR
jgi:GNAT superfamily N-acetyltransferase